MSATWFVGRHAAAAAWARARGLGGTRFVEHLDVDAVAEGDVVIGTLPVHLAAAVCGKGARFVFLAMEIPPDARGKELSADDMDRFGARLIEYRIEEVGEYRPPATGKGAAG